MARYGRTKVQAPIIRHARFVAPPTPVSATFSLAYESGAPLFPVTQTISAAYEAVVVAGDTERMAYEAQVGLSAVRSTAYEGTFAVSQAVSTAYDALIGISYVASDAYEASGFLTATTKFAYEAAQGTVVVTQTVSAAYDALLGLGAVNSDAYEAPTGISRVYSDAYDTLIGVSRVYSDAYEALIGVSDVNSDAYDATGQVVATTQAAYEAQAIGVLVATFPTAYEGTVAVTATISAAYEGITPVAHTVTSTLEANITVTAVVGALYEAGAGIALITATFRVAYEARTTYQSAILNTAGLVSYWRLGESSGNALDYKDSNPAEFPMSGPTTQRNRPGLLQDDPDGAAGNVPDVHSTPLASVFVGANLDDAALGPRFSIECWVRSDSHGPFFPGYSPVVVGQTAAWNLRLTDGTGWRFRALDTSGIDSTATSPDGTAVPGVRQHLVGVYDKNGVIKLYVNGVDVSTPDRTPDANSLHSSGGAYSQIWFLYGSAGTFLGDIDEVAIYNTALDAATIADHYSVGSGGFNDVAAYFQTAYEADGGWPISTLVDTFAGPEFSSRWVTWTQGPGASVVIEDGRAKLTVADGDNAQITSDSRYAPLDEFVIEVDIQGNSSVDVELELVAPYGYSALIHIDISPGDWWGMISDLVLHIEAGDETRWETPTVPYDPISMRWWRVRLDDTTMRIETSADCDVWIEQLSFDNWDDIGASYYLDVSHYMVDNPASVYLDNVNNPIIILGLVNQSFSTAYEARGQVTRTLRTTYGSEGTKLDVAATNTLHYESRALGSTTFSSQYESLTQFGFTTYRGAILSTPGLVSYWRLNDLASIIDSKGTSSPGSVAGDVTQVPGLIDSDVDKAVRGDGALGTVITVPQSAKMETGAQLSVECWVKLEGYVVGAGIVSRYGPELLWLLAQTTNGAYRWYVRDANSTDSIVDGASATVLPGQRQHLVGTYDATTGAMRLYVDGVFGGIVSGPVNASVRAADDVPVRLLTMASQAGMTGTLDEVALYNIALTQQQVLDHFRVGQQKAPTPTFSTPYYTGGTVRTTFSVAYEAAHGAGVVATTPISTAYESLRPLLAVSYSSIVVNTPGLVSYWRLNDSGADSVIDAKGGNHGVTRGGVTRRAAGLLGSDTDLAMRGDGDPASCVQFPANANMNVGSQLSVELWVRPDALARDDRYVFVYNRNLLYWWIRHYTTGDGRWEFYVEDVTGAYWDITSPDSVAAAPGVRQHLVMTYKASGTMVAYINGVAVKLPIAVGSADAAYAATASMYLFSRDVPGEYGFQGVIDDVSFYNVELTPQQVLDRYLAGTALIAPAVISTAYEAPLPLKPVTVTFTVAYDAPTTLAVSATMGYEAAATSGYLVRSFSAAYESLVRLGFGDYSTMVTNTPGLVSYWRMGESAGNLLDSKDSNDAIPRASGGFIRRIESLIDSEDDTATGVDGRIGAHFEAPHNDNMNVGAKLSVEFWIRPNVLAVDESIQVVTYEAGGYGQCWYVRYYSAGDGRWEFTVYDTNFVRRTAASDTPVAIPGLRQHVVLTYNAAGSLRGYIDGVAAIIPLAANANVLSFASATIRLLARNGSSRSVDGVVDDISLYNVELTAAEVLTRYRSGTYGSKLAWEARGLVTQSFKMAWESIHGLRTVSRTFTASYAARGAPYVVYGLAYEANVGLKPVFRNSYRSFKNLDVRFTVSYSARGIPGNLFSSAYEARGSLAVVKRVAYEAPKRHAVALTTAYEAPIKLPVATYRAAYEARTTVKRTYSTAFESNIAVPAQVSKRVVAYESTTRSSSTRSGRYESLLGAIRHTDRLAWESIGRSRSSNLRASYESIIPRSFTFHSGYRTTIPVRTVISVAYEAKTFRPLPTAWLRAEIEVRPQFVLHYNVDSTVRVNGVLTPALYQTTLVRPAIMATGELRRPLSIDISIERDADTRVG